MKTILVDMTDKDFYKESGIITSILKEYNTKLSFPYQLDDVRDFYSSSNIEVIFKISTYDTNIVRFLRNLFTLWRFRYEMHLMCKAGIIVSIAYGNDGLMEKVCYNDYVKGGSR